MERKKPTVRRLALDVLMRMTPGSDTDGGGYSNLLLDAVLRKNDLSDPDRALLTCLVFGVTERRLTLDRIAASLSSRPLNSLDRDVLNILRLGLYQLRYMDRIPVHAAVNETVELARSSGKGFVNAVLRSYQRRAAAGYELPDDLSARYSVCPGLAERLVGVYGRERAERMLEACFLPTGIPLRVNPLKGSRENLLFSLAADGYDAVPTENSPDGILVRSGGLPDAVRDGRAMVQDEASQICVRALDPRPGQTVLDACACPGSKSFGAAMLMENTGTVISRDLHASKLSLITDGALRLGLSSVRAEQRDSSLPVPEDVERFDRVLCDVPCSGYGVIRKKPELRYKDPASCAALPELQYAILDACCRAVKPGGLLIYSTCTILPEENERNADRFLASHPGFTPHPFRVGSFDAPEGRLLLTPELSGTDGFFIAGFRKAEND